MKDIMKQYILDLKKSRKKKYVLALVVCISAMVMFSNMICNIVFASSESISNQEKRFVSVKIKTGDTLWEIAGEYYHKSGQDKMSDYIKEIKLCNGLTGNVIHEGSYLIIPYMRCNGKELK